MQYLTLINRYSFNQGIIDIKHTPPTFQALFIDKYLKGGGCHLYLFKYAQKITQPTYPDPQQIHEYLGQASQLP